MSKSKRKTRTDNDTQAASLIESLEADVTRLTGDDPPTQDDLAIACGCFIGFPMLLEMIECHPKWTDGAKHRARMSAESLYHAATTALAHEAGRRKMDPHPLLECGRVVTEIYRDSDKLYHRRGIYDTWPECMGPWRYELPADQQAAIREGKAAFDRLVIDLDITPAPPAALKGKSQSAGTRRKPGRPSDTDPAADARIYDAWASGHYRTYADCAAARGITPHYSRSAG